MSPRYFFTVVAFAAFLLSTSIIATAQTAPLRGHVIMKNADGTSARVADAVIDVFRVDVAGKYETKTGKNGEFVFAGLPFVGRYIIAASKAGAQPNSISQVRAGQDIDYEIELFPSGDGKRLTLAEINAVGGSASSSGGKVSAEEMAKRAEMTKKNAEITAANKKAETSNAIIDRTFKAGNEAYIAKNYDAAIAHFDEGLAADPDHPGAPALLTNKSVALKARGVDRYNAALKLTDDAAKSAGMEAAKKDWREATEAGTKAVALIKAVPASPTPDPNSKLSLYFALGARAEATRLFVVKVDQSKVEDGVTAYHEYIAAEADPVKKAKTQSDLAQMLLDAGAGDKALVEFKKILADKPDDPDAMYGAGLALYATGDKAKYQEAANYFQLFVDKAPDTHKDKEAVKAVLAELKASENVVPEKTTPTRRRRP